MKSTEYYLIIENDKIIAKIYTEDAWRIYDSLKKTSTKKIVLLECAESKQTNT